MTVLGYTEVTLDNKSGKEQQPWSSIKYWSSLTASEKAAAVVLGYTQITWDNDSGLEVPPYSSSKGWNELAACGEGENRSTLRFCVKLYHIPPKPIALVLLFSFRICTVSVACHLPYVDCV